eukprot:3410036-Rhodomonas_salina.2
MEYCVDGMPWVFDWYAPKPVLCSVRYRPSLRLSAAVLPCHAVLPERTDQNQIKGTTFSRRENPAALHHGKAGQPPPILMYMCTQTAPVYIYGSDKHATPRPTTNPRSRMPAPRTDKSVVPTCQYTCYA